MTESMREKMARAAWYALNQSELTRESDPYEIAAAFDMADAILDVLAEPSNELCEHGSDHGRHDIPPITTSQADAAWAAMIATIKAGA